MRYKMLLNKETWRMRNPEFHLACSASIILDPAASATAIFTADRIHHIAGSARAPNSNCVGVRDKLKL